LSMLNVVRATPHLLSVCLILCVSCSARAGRLDPWPCRTRWRRCGESCGCATMQPAGSRPSLPPRYAVFSFVGLELAWLSGRHSPSRVAERTSSESASWRGPWPRCRISSGSLPRRCVTHVPYSLPLVLITYTVAFRFEGPT
jgi:hypothetical protein